MILKRKADQTKPIGLAHWLRLTGAGLIAAVTAATAIVGCLDRPVQKQEPQTSNLFVAEIRQTAVDKIDLLFMIDNSISMADKQAILGDAVGGFMARLVTPLCVDEQSRPVGGNADETGRCANGSPEFSPIKDIHIGVVSSSLGAHGGQTCNTADADDKGQLVQTVRPAAGVTTWNGNSGFLAWDPDPARARNNPRGETNPGNLKTNFKNLVLAVDQVGCGFEASLEAWYRFLIEPNPYVAVPAATETGNLTQPQFVDPATPAANPVLVQRSQFLRPDSLVAIVMLSDENDCSIRDEGQGWLVGQQNLNGGAFHMPRATSQCEQNPNDKCCQSCAAVAAAQGCEDPKKDAVCAASPTWPAGDDNLNLRCFDQKRRFGFDLLYPTSRYVNGLYETTVPDVSQGKMVPNPLYAGSPPRDRSLVFIAGIVGVPWQDVSTSDSWPDGAPLKYQTWEDLNRDGRWQWILGDEVDPAKFQAPSLPGDKLMVETPKDRTTLFPGAVHPGIGAAGALAPNTATGRPNVINGHESKIDDNSDLQYACIFKLPQVRQQCSGTGCDCKPEDQAFNRALCDGTSQSYAKAYPGVRELEVLRDYGAKGSHNAIVASICPKTLANQNDPSYGYNPAVSAIVDRLKEALRGKCLPRKLQVEDNPDRDDFGKVPCAVVEAYVPQPGAACDCSASGRVVASDELKAPSFNTLQNSGYCGKGTSTECAAYCLCEIEQFKGDQLLRCQSDTTTPSDIYGYCYVDPSTVDEGSDLYNKQAAIVASCPASQKRLLRFTGENVPAKGSIALIACLGSSLRE